MNERIYTHQSENIKASIIRDYAPTHQAPKSNCALDPAPPFCEQNILDIAESLIPNY